MSKTRQRLDRQFDVMVRRFPALSGLVRFLRADHSRLIRIPLGILMIVGGVFSFLPLLGIWMLPLGLMLLAVDIPFLRGPVARLMIKVRRWSGRWLRPTK